MDNWNRIIVHVDMDAFFSSVEQLMHPAWKGKPVIVGADPKDGKGRGVVSTASYEARKFGVHSAMPISLAYRLCPHGIYVRPHGDIYYEYSKKIISILKQFTPIIEVISIDEAFMDLTGNKHFFKNIAEIGIRIKTEVKKNISLSASVGIAPNKCLAKIASDFQKPDGLTIVYPDEIQEFLNPLPVTKLWGIGKKTFEQLRKMGIETVYQLHQYPLEVLEKKLGKIGLHIYQMARGEDKRDVIDGEDAKSVSNEITFEQDQIDYEYVRKTVFALSEKVSGRLRRSGVRGTTIHLKIRFAGFKTYTRSHTIENPTNLTDEIYQLILFMLCEFNPLPDAVRLVGVGISNLMEEQDRQMNFWEQDKEKKIQAEKVMDQLQDRYGKSIIKHAESIFSKNPDQPRNSKRH
jgi:DNA polymerase-4